MGGGGGGGGGGAGEFEILREMCFHYMHIGGAYQMACVQPLCFARASYVCVCVCVWRFHVRVKRKSVSAIIEVHLV